MAKSNKEVKDMIMGCGCLTIIFVVLISVIVSLFSGWSEEDQTIQTSTTIETTSTTGSTSNLVDNSDTLVQDTISNSNDSIPLAHRTEYTLVSVVDGDTIKVKDSTNKFHTIRMIGLDAPESTTTRYGYVECFGEEAKKHLEELLTFPTIVLEIDESQGETDKYQRLLWYIFIGDLNINLRMIADWYWFEYTYNLPYRYQSEFKNAQKIAASAQLGLRWPEACNWERRNISTSHKKKSATTTKTSTTTSNGKVYHIWPRGGCYYYNSNHKKQYVDKSLCLN